MEIIYIEKEKENAINSKSNILNLNNTLDYFIDYL